MTWERHSGSAWGTDNTILKKILTYILHSVYLTQFFTFTFETQKQLWKDHSLFTLKHIPGNTVNIQKTILHGKVLEKPERLEELVDTVYSIIWGEYFVDNCTVKPNLFLTSKTPVIQQTKLYKLVRLHHYSSPHCKLDNMACLMYLNNWYIRNNNRIICKNPNFSRSKRL